MRQESFADCVSDALPGLHRFFFYHLKKSCVTGNIEQHVEELIQTTTSKAFLNSQKKSLARYSIRSLLSVKAKNELANFYMRIKKSTRLITIDANLEIPSPDPDPYERLVFREALSKLHTQLERETLEIFFQLIEDAGYREVAARHKLTEGALKMRICRLRKDLLKNLFDS